MTVKDMMLRSGLTRREIAVAAGVTTETMKRWERNKTPEEMQPIIEKAQRYWFDGCTQSDIEDYAKG